MRYITMSQKEINRYDIIKKLLNKEINGPDTVDLLDLSARQVRRLKVRVKEYGAQGLIHGNRGKPSNRQIPDKEKEEIITLLHEHYTDFKPGFATEKLEENHKIIRDSKTIRQIMIDEGLWQPRKKKNSDYRSWRQRKACFGEMGQFDGSYEYWFEDRGPKCCLLACIDDATSIITKAKFDEHEGVFPVFAFWREYLAKNGKLYSIYVDKFSTYKMNQKVAVENHDTHTQFQRAMNELGIEIITAHSSQAKGRVEKLFGTLQDRLIKELRLADISTIPKANEFLEKIFLPKYNARFAVEPRAKANLHKKLTEKEVTKLNSVFSRQDKRIVRNDFTISFNNQWYQLTKNQPVTVCKKDTVIIEEHLDNTINFRLRGKYLNYELLPERPKRMSKNQPWVLAKTAVVTPAPDHPWRRFQYSNKIKQIPK